MASANPTEQRAVLGQADGAVETHMDHDWTRGVFGEHMLRVAVSQSELVRTADYENVMLGPVQVVGFIPDGPDEQVKEGIRRLRRLVDESIAEDRQILYNELQARAAAGQPARMPPTAPLGKQK